MRTALFELVDPTIKRSDPQFDRVNELYIVPTLPAYAIVSYNLQYRSSFFEPMHPEHEIVSDSVRIRSVPAWFPTETRQATLSVQYAGIRDHSLLFPSVERADLRKRLGEFAEEAETAYENGSWMSFTVMAISAIEGLLCDTFGQAVKKWEKRKTTHGELARVMSFAIEEGALDPHEGALLSEARRVRNRIHAGRFYEPLACRSSATDMYVLYDRLLKKDWKKIKLSFTES
jgi:hypothetical protein